MTVRCVNQYSEIHAAELFTTSQLQIMKSNMNFSRITNLGLLSMWRD